MNSAFVGYEELSRSWRVLSTSTFNFRCKLQYLGTHAMNR